MNTLEQLIGLLANGLAISLLLGLLYRRRYRSSLAFTLYVFAVAVADSLISLWPEYFYTRRFWLARELVYNSLKLAIAVELSLKTFSAFPGARATAQRTTFLVLVVTFIAVISAPGAIRDYKELAGALLPRVINGTLWLFTAIGALILWYRLPVDPFHKVILIGFVPFLLIFTFALHTLRTFGWELREYAGYAQTVAYIGLLAFWNWAAWDGSRRQRATRDPGDRLTPPPPAPALPGARN